MNYSIAKIQFNSKARFGIRNLESTFKICHSDTLFSALFIEAKDLYGIDKAKKFKEECDKGKIKISSAMPYFFDKFEDDYRLFLPKPIIYVNNDKIKKNEADNNVESIKKVLKKIDFIQVSDFENYLDKMGNKDTSDIYSFANKMMEQTIDIKVNLEEKQNKIYNIASNVYLNKLENDDIEIDGNCGLYFVIKYEENEELELIKNTLNSLQYTGIGGKRSIGYGKFKIIDIQRLEESNYNDEKILYELIKKSEKSKYKMLISLLSPKKEEIDDFNLDDMYYSLIKRGGFVFSNNYSENNQKKKDIYMLEEGSTLTKEYSGDIKNLETDGRHEVYRYGLGMYVGFDI